MIVVIGLALVVVMTNGVEAAGECTMTAVLPADLQSAGATIDVRYALSGLTHGDAFEVADGSVFQWRLNVSGFRGPWRAGTGVCGELRLDDCRDARRSRGRPSSGQHSLR